MHPEPIHYAGSGRFLDEFCGFAAQARLRWPKRLIHEKMEQSRVTGSPVARLSLDALWEGHDSTVGSR